MPTRRTGAIVLGLFLAGVCGALAIARVTGSGVASAAAGLLPTLAGTYLAWAAFRADRVEAATGRGLEQIADELAVAVRRQWEAETRVRRLNDPYPLAVSWKPHGRGAGGGVATHHVGSRCMAQRAAQRPRRLGIGPPCTCGHRRRHRQRTGKRPYRSVGRARRTRLRQDHPAGSPGSVAAGAATARGCCADPLFPLHMESVRAGLGELDV